MRRRADYSYELPPELVAQAPADRREDSRLLELGGEIHRFSALPELLPANALIVANDARVRPARLHTVKVESGGAVELLLLEPTASPRQWRALARASKPIRDGASLRTSSGAIVVVTAGRGDDGSIEVELPEDVDALCARDGELPLPPYIRRPDGPGDADQDRYQTVYAARPGAIAAPTAGLHFTPALIAELEGRGIEWHTLTLHVGIGTFSPVRAENIDDHTLHSERFEIAPETARAVTAARSAGRPIVAIGTTVVRALEAAALGDAGATSLFITPGFPFRVVDHLVTNFHLPESSLLMLVCAFAGHAETMAAYRAAVAAKMRFFSYGDAMLASRKAAS